MALLDKFVTDHEGDPLEVEDPSARDQCMDLAFAWADAIGLNRSNIRNQFAKNVWTNHGNGVVVTANPTPGDFVVWGNLVGLAGHIGVFLSGSPTNFTSFDQNWNNVQRCVKVNHNNYGVLGFLHPVNLGGSVANVTIDQAEYQDLKNWKAAATAPGVILVQSVVLQDAQRWKDYAINTMQPQLDDLKSQLAEYTDGDKATADSKKLKEIINLINSK